MTHPLEQLAGAVDGTLAPAERATLTEHLRSCTSCRDEVKVAAAARSALRAMPAPAAPDLAAGFTPDRIAALTSSVSSTVHSPWSRRVAPALAASAIVAVLALVVPRLGSSSNDRNIAASGPATADVVTDGPVRLQLEDTDYDVVTLSQLTGELTASLGADTTGSTDDVSAIEVGSGASVSSTPNEQRFVGNATRQAVACLNKAFPRYPGEIVQVRQAAFEGEPAYLAVVLESEPDGAPADAVSIWVAAIEDCSILTVTPKSL
ncbi:MAG: zf-HC2 domain-containing protein [Actinomycetota bacterium]